MTWLPGGSVAAVDHEQDVRRRRALVGAEPGPVAEVGRQQRGEVGERRGHHPHRPDRVGLLRAQGVRQPLEPVPVREVLLGGEHRDDEVVGGVEGGGRADHRRGPSARAGSSAPQTSIRSKARRSIEAGRFGLQPVHDQQPVQRGRGGRVDLVDRGALRRDQLERERLGAHAVPHVQEVGVGRRRAPTPGSAPRPARAARPASGWCQVSARALLVGGLARDLADVGEVAEVLRAGARSPAGCAASAAGRAGRR